MQYWEHRTVANGIQELVDVPRRRQSCGLRFAVTDDSGNNQVRVIEGCSAGMREDVPQLAPFVYRTGCFRCAVAADPAGKGKLLKERAQPLFVFTLVGVDFGVASFQIHGTNHAWSSMPRPGKIDHVQIILLDEPVQVDVNERQPWTRSKMPQKPVLDVLWLQRLF